MARRSHEHHCGNKCGALLGTCEAPADYDGTPNTCTDEAFWHDLWCDDCTAKRCETCGCSPCEDVIACARDRQAMADYAAREAAENAWLDANENSWLC